MRFKKLGYEVELREFCRMRNRSETKGLKKKISTERNIRLRNSRKTEFLERRMSHAHFESCTNRIFTQ